MIYPSDSTAPVPPPGQKREPSPTSIGSDSRTSECSRRESSEPPVVRPIVPARPAVYNRPPLQ